MGSPISPVISNIFMKHFEKEALKKNTHKIRSLIPLFRRHIRDMETRQSRTP